MTQNKIEEQTKLYLEAFLPDALSNALESYQRFSGAALEHKKTKDFLDHHKACKVAIAHVELLLKLSKSVDISENLNQKNIKNLLLAQRRVQENKEKQTTN